MDDGRLRLQDEDCFEVLDGGAGVAEPERDLAQPLMGGGGRCWFSSERRLERLARRLGAIELEQEITEPHQVRGPAGIELASALVALQRGVELAPGLEHHRQVVGPARIGRAGVAAGGKGTLRRGEQLVGQVVPAQRADRGNPFACRHASPRAERLRLGVELLEVVARPLFEGVQVGRCREGRARVGLRVGRSDRYENQSEREQGAARDAHAARHYSILFPVPWRSVV